MPGEVQFHPTSEILKLYTITSFFFVKFLRYFIHYVISDVVVQHANDGRSLVVRNVVKNLVDFIRMADWHFDGMRILQTVEIQGRSGSVGDELRPDFELGEEMVDAKRFDERGVAFVQPQMSPPFLSKQNISDLIQFLCK